MFALLCTAAASSLAGTTNRLDTRIFRNHPRLFFPSRILEQNSTKYVLTMQDVLDDRPKHFGDTAYQDVIITPYEDFWKDSLPKELTNWMTNAFANDITPRNASDRKPASVSVKVVQFFPAAFGFMWVKSFAKVRLEFRVRSEGHELFSDTCDASYLTTGMDSQWEGSLFQTIEQGTNITIGIALGKCYDQFQSGFNGTLAKPEGTRE
jgi:hypothetical protein